MGIVTHSDKQRYVNENTRVLQLSSPKRLNQSEITHQNVSNSHNWQIT